MPPESKPPSCLLFSVPCPLSPLLLVFVLTFAVFHSALDNEFVNWDDPMFIVENPSIKSLDWNHLRDFFTTLEVGAYTPLSRLSYALDWAVWGNNPVGFHLTNLLLHCLNACLVFLIARKLFAFSLRSSAFSLFPPLLVALLFSFHPLRVESVAWASERRDVLSVFFALACALTWLRYCENQNQDKQRSLPPRQGLPAFRLYLASFLLFVCSVISKPSTVTLPIALIFLEFYLSSLSGPVRRGKRGFILHLSSLILRFLPFFLVSLATGLSLMSYLVESGKALDVQQADWGARIAQAQVANLDYLRKLLLPIHLNPLNKLSGLYHFDQPIVWWSLIFNATITLVLLRFFRRFPSLLLAWLSWLVMILPFSGLGASGSQFTADRYTYLAGAPLCLMAGGAFQWGLEKAWVKTTGLISLAIALLAWWGWLTDRQIRIWRNSETLWVHSLKLDKANFIAWNNLGEALETKAEDLAGGNDFAGARKKREESISALKQALRWYPAYSEAWYNLGNEFNQNGQYADARRAFQQALRYNPAYAEAWHNLGILDARDKDWTSALKHYHAAERLSPSSTTEYNIGCCLRESGNAPAALEAFKSAAEGGFLEAWVDWGDLLFQKGDLPSAIALLREGVQRTKNSRIQLALVEMILRQKIPPPSDLSMARALLREVDRKTGGRSERVHALQTQMEKFKGASGN